MNYKIQVILLLVAVAIISAGCSKAEVNKINKMQNKVINSNEISNSPVIEETEIDVSNYYSGSENSAGA